jgi:cell division transport system permease protein
MSALKHTWHHIRRSPFQSLTAVILMTVTFFTLSSFAVISNGMSSVLKFFETKPEVTIFLKDGLDMSTIENTQKELSNYQNIKEIKFVSKEKALEIYKQQNKGNPMLTEMVTASILPASFEVSVSDPKVLEQIATNFASKTNVVDEIVYQKDVINSLLTWTSFIRKTGIILISATGLVSFLIIFVTIGMKITNRKDEIKISRLLGASKYYVKRPFLLEGVFYGLIGSILGTVLSFSIIFYFASQINDFFKPVIFISSNVGFYCLILAGAILLGTLIGFLASWIGVKRYIKF